jgi:protein-S-isoprenylcysteine O-methyltransferase Ste14
VSYAAERRAGGCGHCLLGDGCGLGHRGAGPAYWDYRSHVARQLSKDAGSFFWVLGGVVAGLLAGLAFNDAHVLTLPGPTVWLVIGLTVAWTGMLLRYWAVRTLGPLFTTTVVIHPRHHVVSNGPYRVVRHPAYLGLMLFLFGLGVAMADLASVMAMVVLPAIGLAKRIAVEEAALRASLGDSYDSYCAGRARLIPGIW